MSWRNLLRFVGVLCMVALLVAIPQLWITIMTTWFSKNLIVMAVLLVADAFIGLYLMYLVARYMVIQYWERILEG